MDTPAEPDASLTLFDLTRCHFFKACGNWVSDVEVRGPVCVQCRRSFGGYLRPVERPVTEDAPAPPAPPSTAQRFGLAVAALGHQPPPPEQEVKRNQICWLCEDRHTCTRTPSGWECATCRE